MKIVVLDDNFIIYKLKNNLDIDNLSKEEIERNIKKILIYVKKRYLKSISGFYNVILYSNKKYGLILEVNKESDLDFFPDLVDIKLKIVSDFDIYLKFDDYFLIKDYEVYYYDNYFYVNIDDLSNKDIICLSDYYEITYGEGLDKIRCKLKLVKSAWKSAFFVLKLNYRKIGRK